jgi:hypothetical protein
MSEDEDDDAEDGEGEEKEEGSEGGGAHSPLGRVGAVVGQVLGASTVLYISGFLEERAVLARLGVPTGIPIVKDGYLVEGGLFALATFEKLIWPWGLIFLVVVSVVAVALAAAQMDRAKRAKRFASYLQELVTNAKKEIVTQLGGSIVVLLLAAAGVVLANVTLGAMRMLPATQDGTLCSAPQLPSYDQAILRALIACILAFLAAPRRPSQPPTMAPTAPPPAAPPTSRLEIVKILTPTRLIFLRQRRRPSPPAAIPAATAEEASAKAAPWWRQAVFFVLVGLATYNCVTLPTFYGLAEKLPNARFPLVRLEMKREGETNDTANKDDEKRDGDGKGQVSLAGDFLLLVEDKDEVIASNCEHVFVVRRELVSTIDIVKSVGLKDAAKAVGHK